MQQLELGSCPLHIVVGGETRGIARRLVDDKAVPTRNFRLKAKLMKACFGIEVEVIK